MGVEDERIGRFDSGEFFPAFFAQVEKSPVGRVDVKPEAELLGQCREVRKRIDSSRIGGAGIADDEERPQSFFPVGPDGVFKEPGNGPVFFIRSQEADIPPGMPAKPATFITQWWV